MDINMRSCGATTAEISWTPGSDNNVPIEQYIVYYNTSYDAAGEYTEGTRVGSTKQSARIRLSPWADYSFHVRAVSAMGMSARSAFTSSVCTSPPDIPYQNPTGVCTVDRAPSQLVIVWDVSWTLDFIASPIIVSDTLSWVAIVLVNKCWKQNAQPELLIDRKLNVQDYGLRSIHAINPYVGLHFKF